MAAVLRAGRAGPDVLLMRRADHPQDPWSGHMSFPGGRQDGGDPDLLSTALRETREEVGIDMGTQAELLGRLDDVPAISRARPTGMVITPFVFELLADVPLRPNAEVAEVFWAPIDPMIRGELDTTRDYVHEGRTLVLPAYDVRGRIVWGLTFRMLQLLFERLRP